MPTPRRLSPWRWMLAAALLGGVIYGTGLFIERGGVARTLQQAHPGWLLAAVFLQAGTYLAQAQVWRAVARAGGWKLPVREAYALSLAKLFVDQTVPSGGVSGSLFAARAMRRQAIPRGVRLACVGINLTSYYAAYAFALLAGAAVLGHRRRGRELAAVAAVFLLIGAVTAWLFRKLASQRTTLGRPRFLLLARLTSALHGADPALVGSRRLLAICAALQLAVIALDSATLWVLTLSLGAVPPPARVFSAFMVANVARTVTFVPGGLGPFEAGAVLALRKAAHVPVATALAATLIFRLLSFWLPMIPGFLAARRRYYGVGTQT